MPSQTITRNRATIRHFIGEERWSITNGDRTDVTANFSRGVLTDVKLKPKAKEMTLPRRGCGPGKRSTAEATGKLAYTEDGAAVKTTTYRRGAKLHFDPYVPEFFVQKGKKRESKTALDCLFLDPSGAAFVGVKK